MAKTFTSFSFGCRVNMAEKEALDRQLRHRGLTEDAKSPDIYILNTCSVTHKAEREARQMINQIRKKHEKAKIVVMGCAATNWIKRKVSVDHVDLMVENPSKEFIADMILERFGEAKIASQIEEVPAFDTATTAQSYVVPDDKYTRSGRIILKIQDGCQRFCTYCIVPYLRGLPTSVPMEDLITQIINLPPEIKEVIYTAINTEAYGYDTKKEDFVDLIRYTLDMTRIPRISFGSLHPWSVNEKLFELLRSHPRANRIVQFYHIPLQSGNDKMLRLMKRGYTRQEFVEKLHELVSIQPMAFIGTDIIVGFLEETDADFEDTYRFLEQTPISRIHIFRYSERQHTAASYLGKRLKEPTPQEKQRRAQALAELNTRKYRAFMEKHIGQTFEALFMEQQKEGNQRAVLSNGVSVWVPTSTDLRTQLKPVQVERVEQGSLYGKVL
jgi:threonylcarbamoyladenosine tRNA methylthiotransferase MtaB